MPHFSGANISAMLYEEGGQLVNTPGTSYPAFFNVVSKLAGKQVFLIAAFWQGIVFNTTCFGVCTSASEVLTRVSVQ